MSTISKEAVGIVGNAALSLASRALVHKSPQQVHRLGEKYGRLTGRVLRKRRLVAKENLRRAFPNLSELEIDRLSLQVFEHFGRSIFDFLASKGRTMDEFLATTEVSGVREAFDEALSKGKGVLFASGHIGNWERIPAYLSMCGYPVTVIIRDANTDNVNNLVNTLREAPGTRVLPRGDATRPMLERLRKNEIIGILADQNADDVFVDFFGHPAGTAKGLGVIAERTGAAVLPVTCVYSGEDRYRILVNEELKPAGKNDVRGESTMRSFNKWLEECIRQNPDQWLWLHDRWRSAKERGLA